MPTPLLPVAAQVPLPLTLTLSLTRYLMFWNILYRMATASDSCNEVPAPTLTHTQTQTQPQLEPQPKPQA